MGRMLARQRPAADGDARAVVVHHQLAPGLAIVPIATGTEVRSVGIDRDRNLFPLRPPAGVVTLKMGRQSRALYNATTAKC
jgi:hypothetical protein